MIGWYATTTECLFSMASSATAFVRSIVSRTALRLRRCGRNGASNSKPVLSKDLSARHSGYSWRIDATTAFVNGEAILLTGIVLKLRFKTADVRDQGRRSIEQGLRSVSLLDTHRHKLLEDCDIESRSVQRTMSKLQSRLKPPAIKLQATARFVECSSKT